MSASLAPECSASKDKYDTCFLKWYSEKYLRGKSSPDECADLFKDYKSCLTKVLKERGIDRLLEDARRDAGEADIEHLRKS